MLLHRLRRLCASFSLVAAESSTALSALKWTSPFSALLPFGTREAAALAPAGKPAPAGDLLEILVLKILAALLVRLWVATIFVAIVEHFCVYLRIGVNVKMQVGMLFVVVHYDRPEIIPVFLLRY